DNRNGEREWSGHSEGPRNGVDHGDRRPGWCNVVRGICHHGESMTRKLWLPILGSLLAPLALRGQSATPVAAREPLKARPVVVRTRASCPPTVTQASSPTEVQRRDARDMAQRARQSAILGDASASLSQLRGAAGLDPTDPNLAYELARAYESAGVLTNATA